MAAPFLMRDYGWRAVEKLLASRDTNTVLVSPTGSGKTPIACNFARRRDEPLLWAVHKTELVDQANEHLQHAGVRDFVTMSVQKLAHRGIPDHVKYIFIDECHHFTLTGQYAQLFDTLPVFGATATPFRLDGRGLGGGFDRIVVAAYVAELVANGWIQNPTIYSHPAPDMTGAKVIGGDYSRKELNTRSNIKKLRADIVRTWLTMQPGRTLIFASSIDHSKELVAEFNANGVKALHVDGKSTDRADIFAALATGAVDIVSNVDICGEGLDLPDLDCVVLARATASLGRYLQWIGRVMRPTGKAIVLDHAGNALRHGSPLRRIEYTLSGKERIQGEPLGLKMCKECLVMLPYSVSQCPYCNSDTSPAARAKQSIDDGELVPFSDRLAVWEQSPELYKSIFKEEPIVIDGKLIEPSKENKRKVFFYFLDKAKRKGYNKGYASHQYKRIYNVWPKMFVKEVNVEVFGCYDGGKKW